MIVITGPGRSGTSFLAQAYKNAGLDPGGRWDPTVRAGLEDPSVARLNRTICNELDVSLLGVKRDAPSTSEMNLPFIEKYVKRLISPDRRRQFRNRLEQLPGNRTGFSGLDWAKVNQVVERMGPELRAAASVRVVVKDPLFCLTLPIWLQAQADVDAVVLTSRPLDAMVASRAAAGHLGHKTTSDSKNSFIYAFGNAFCALQDHGVPFTHVRFPDCLEHLEELAARLPVPPPWTSGDMRSALVLAAEAGKSGAHATWQPVLPPPT